MRDFELTSWQNAFIGKYLTDSPKTATLVSKAGMGKSFVALKLIELLALNRGQWANSLIKYFDPEIKRNLTIFNENIHQLGNDEKKSQLRELLLSNTFILVDELHAPQNSKLLQNFLHNDIASNTNSQLLFLSFFDQSIGGVNSTKYFLGTEYIYDDSVLKKKTLLLEIARFSPSYDILQKVLKKGLKFDNLNWREFEKLVAQLLEMDGYKVELMQGTKDGGVDVIAIKDYGISGFYKTIWQAKKFAKNKVTLSTIRELADSVHEFKASKGIIVTSTFLTSGALQRVERDKYTLSKIDRNDLESWINKILRQ